MSIISREGYGANFNNLYRINDLIKKEAKNEYGKAKIKNEIAFLKYVSDNKIKFPIPEILEYTEYSYTMKYYDSHKPLFHIWSSLNPSEHKNILLKIKQSLYKLYVSSSKRVSKEVYTSLLLEEVETKLYKRLNQIEGLLDKYKHIKKVNNLLIPDIKDIFAYFKQKSIDFINSKHCYVLYPIHGDCQFNNILINNEDIIFIDPRGNYGSSVIYGTTEYDNAKIKFALSGYDTFDSMKIESLNINDDSITVDDLRLVDTCISNNEFSSILALSIWLGNAHCFIDNEYKAFYSYAYAMWLIASHLKNA